MRRSRNNRFGIAAGAAVALGLVLSACGGSGKWQGGAKDDDMRGKFMAQRAKLAKKGILATVATATSMDLQTAIDKVELDCRAQMARVLETKIEGMQKTFNEEVGGEFVGHFTSATKSITSTVLSGTVLTQSPYRRSKDGRYEVHGLMVLDTKSFKGLLERQLAANEALKARWAASRAYQELDKEAKEFDAYKREQGL